MSAFVPPERLDCCDPWEKSLSLAKNCGLSNKMILTPPVLSGNEFSKKKYDLIYAYSIFTHLPETDFIRNVRILVNCLTSGGLMIFTVREPHFLKYMERTGLVSDAALDEAGFWFGNAQNANYGDTVVNEAWIDRNLAPLGEIKRVGALSSEPFQCIITITKR
nr:hypothetical protein [Bosea sp. (in: a-proteobacteria)]